MIPDIYLEFIKQINMPYWSSGKKLNIIFINEYIVVIKYLDIIKDVLQKSSYIKIKYENSDSNNDDLVHNDLMFLDDIRIYCNQEFIKITIFFNSSVVYSKNHINVYKDENYESYCNFMTKNKLF